MLLQSSKPSATKAYGGWNDGAQFGEIRGRMELRFSAGVRRAVLTALELLMEERYDDRKRAADDGRHFFGYCEDEENNYSV